MISISTITANESGSVIINELQDSRLDDQTARISRVKTLDGGVVITHSGVSVGDRTFNISCRPSESDLVKLQTIFEDETFVLVAYKSDVYLGVIVDIKQKSATTLTIYLQEKVSA